MRPLLACACAALFGLGCGSSSPPVSFVSNERPSGYTAAQGGQAPSAAHRENPNGGGPDLADDDFVEPEHPLADTKEERALVHVHGPKDHACSGVVLGPRIVATAQRCLRGLGPGAVALGPDREYRIEVASSSLTWTNRKAKYAVLPKCDENEFDIGLLVLEEPAPPLVTPLKIVTVPNTGARVQALGFGHCKGAAAPAKERNGTVRSRSSEAFVIELALCQGDAGGPVIDGRDGDVVGLISHRASPRSSPLHTTSVARLDTTWARDLIAQAKGLADGGDVGKVQPVACR